MKLYYDKPVSQIKMSKTAGYTGPDIVWEQSALPLGNGSIGLGVYGEADCEKIVLNHKTLWTGGPSVLRPHYRGGNITKPDISGKMPSDYLKEVQALFQQGEEQKAEKLCNRLVGKKAGYGAYQCWGELEIAYPGLENAPGQYLRELDLDTATCRVSYAAKDKNQNLCHDVRQYFVSHADGVAVLHTKRQEGDLCCTIRLKPSHLGRVRAAKSGLLHCGRLLDNGLKYCAYLAVQTDGKTHAAGAYFSVSGATYCTLYLGMDTDYSDNYPVYRTGESLQDLRARVTDQVDRAVQLGIERLYARHLADYRNLYSRVALDLESSADLPPTDRLVRTYSSADTPESDKRGCETLLYQFGRYLTIASSRENDLLPSNLQGIWNVSNTPPWSSDFHLNVNLQMNYWPVYTSNLAECAAPLVRYINKLREPGRVTALAYTGKDCTKNGKEGFLFHTQNTPFGWTCPGWAFSWGWSPAAVPWILHDVFGAYEYTNDLSLLAQTIYPMLKETASYFSRMLIEHNGRLVTAPCFSPEHGPRTMGNTYEQSLLAQLYLDAIKAAKALHVDADCVKMWEKTLSRLRPIEIGESGQIKEWYHEKALGEIGEKGHRHLSHLLGLYPCSVIDKRKNPEYLRAAVVSLNDRGDKSTGWGTCMRIAEWAHTGDGNRAHRLIQNLISNCIYINLFDTHPPFQIDGNFGYTACVNEMLLQSGLDVLEILPALPDAWPNGFVRGLKAKGNFTVDILWKNGRLEKTTVTSHSGGLCALCSPQGRLTCKAPHSYNEFGDLLVQTQKEEVLTVQLL
ncbi:MAG: glycoside hydrolase family 95 protein [Clostridiales bacterium]|nr:glycoside hydrolase family 95 protein [Clostridiales bacterium]